MQVRGVGRRRLYRIRGRSLKEVFDWVRRYQRTWEARFEQLDVVLEELERKERSRDDEQE